MKYFLILIIFINTAFALECSQVSSFDPTESLNTVTIEDNQIVTADDIRFCPGQALKNADITPDQLPDNGSVWRLGNRRWNDDWEKKYQQWVKDEVHPDLFVELDFPTDCADAAIAIRSIFSRINNLPASFNGQNFTNTSKKYRNHKTVKTWDEDNWKENFKNDKRFTKALGDWLVGTGTVNIHKDTYQVGVWDNESSSPTSCVAPGTVVLSSGHTEILTFDKESLFPYKLSSSTVPAKVRSLEQNMFSFSDLNAYDYDEEKLVNSRGYVWWNWPVNCKGKFIKVEDESMPYFSKEQREKNEDTQSFDLNKAYQQSLGLSNEELVQRVKEEFNKSLDSVLVAIDERKAVVDEAVAYCSANGIGSAQDCFYPTKTISHAGTKYTFKISDIGKIIYPGDEDEYDEIAEQYMCDGCMPEIDPSLDAQNLVETEDFSDFFKPRNTKLEQFYYNQSTPSRDGRLIEKLRSLNSLIWEMDYDSAEESRERLLDTKIELKNGKYISVYHLADMYNFSPQPWDSEELRWGGAEMNNIKHRFMQEHQTDIGKLQMLSENYQINASEENLKDLESFKIENKLFIKEKKIIDDFFAK
jgi:hypothetical protein